MTTASPVTTSASRSQTPSSTTSKPKEPEEPEEPDEPEEPISTPTPTPSATPQACSINQRDLSSRQRQNNGKWGPKYCKIECDEKTGQKVYVWEIRNKVGETDQLVQSMCAGKCRAQQQSISH
jgi:hypothetical protein